MKNNISGADEVVQQTGKVIGVKVGNLTLNPRTHTGAWQEERTDSRKFSSQCSESCGRRITVN